VQRVVPDAVFHLKTGSIQNNGLPIYAAIRDVTS
jgi:hypothetical protein